MTGETRMTIRRTIPAPPAKVWAAWFNPVTLPQWWGPEGFSCRTYSIDLRAGGSWVFDMIGPDGTVYPNHHIYTKAEAARGLAYILHFGENGPKHADAEVTFDALSDREVGKTQVTLSMDFLTVEDCQNAKAFGAEAMGLQTLGKLARFVATGAV